jgi:pyruvate kinase
MTLEKHKFFKIISTIGPASISEEFISICREYQQPYFRFNGSHLNAKQIKKYANFVRVNLRGNSTEIYLDLQGNKLRVGKIPASIPLKPDTAIELVYAPENSSGQIPVNSRQFFNIIKEQDLLYLQDGLVKLEVIGTKNQSVIARCISGEKITSGCGLIIHGKSTAQKQIPTKQVKQVQLAKKLEFTGLALSFVSSDEELIQLRNLCNQLKYFPRIIAKVERQEALDNLEKIINNCDEIWFCRGDLGATLPLSNLGHFQDLTIKSSVKLKRPVYVAGQVFFHLVENPQPTRSEVVHFYYLKKQGVNGIVLSDETAIGKHPVQTVKIISSLL